MLILFVFHKSNVLFILDLLNICNGPDNPSIAVILNFFLSNKQPINSLPVKPQPITATLELGSKPSKCLWINSASFFCF